MRPFHALLVDVFGALDPVPAVAAHGPLHLHYILTGAGAMVFAAAPEARRLTGADPSAADFAARHADVLVELLLRPAPRKKGSR